MSLDHNPQSDTSRGAAADNKPLRRRDRDRVLEALTVAGEYGLTDFELAEVLTRTGPSIGQTSAGKRRLDLERVGLVARRLVIDPRSLELVADRRPSPTKSSAGVYVLASFTEQYPFAVGDTCPVHGFGHTCLVVDISDGPCYDCEVESECEACCINRSTS